MSLTPGRCTSGGFESLPVFRIDSFDDWLGLTVSAFHYADVLL